MFVAPDSLAPVFDALAGVCSRVPEPEADWKPASGIRVPGDAGYPLDVFPSVDEAVYDEIRRRTTRQPFGPDMQLLPFLSAEDLSVFKLSFGRPKDWVDLRAIAQFNPDLDVCYIERQLLALRGPRLYPRLVKLRSFLATGG